MTAEKLGAVIAGAVTLVKSGSGTLTLTRACTTSGDFVVSNGTLAVSATGALGANSTNVVVAGGTLSLSNSTAIADSATLVIANGGAAKVSLAAGVNESVGYLYFGNRQQRAGTYSATAGGGVQKVDTEHLAGTGILRVLRDSAGTAITLR
ncbi:MAG: autotransporter-associated beta strand repeat-containing protein [Kiritimatiellae bacterium]|nr:autotransporter-associated beta strand repeat-containing protein [Kiritimatiellia bacterium]